MLWRSIHDRLHEEIATGHYKPGEKLPTETELACRFGVNRHTVRHAITELRDHGIVYSRRGSGIFVATKPMTYKIGRKTRFSKNLVHAQQAPTLRFLRLETRHADKIELENLALGRTAEVHVVEGIGLSNNIPITHFTSIFPAAPLDGFIEALESAGSISTALAACNILDYERQRTEITAVLATPETAIHLACQVGDPLLRTRSLNQSNNVPIEFGTSLFSANHIAFVVDEDSSA
jgi:GntR family phosphonate transport system transcriptional regulator|tara:strand:- start:4015 stop:4719 length:705 start_codon:yes stop_codon:yes gene_type:complete